MTFNLDEYLPDATGQHPQLPPVHVGESLRRGQRQAGARSRAARRHPEGEGRSSRNEYDAKSSDAGGIDFQILGIGKTGHIGFNGSRLGSRTRLIALDTVTRRDAAADFFGEDNVPTEAITMGVATIMDAREIALIATGEHKAAIVRRAVEGEINLDVAATFLQRHPNATFYVDPAAAAYLTRFAPLVTREVEWTRELEVARSSG